jgi:hypothetical protein
MKRAFFIIKGMFLMEPGYSFPVAHCCLLHLETESSKHAVTANLKLRLPVLPEIYIRPRPTGYDFVNFSVDI